MLGVSYLRKLVALQHAALLKKLHLFPSEFYEISHDSYSAEHLWMDTSNVFWYKFKSRVNKINWTL